MCNDFNSKGIDRRFTGNYSKEEQSDKYRFQHRWQEKNGYIVKTIRINETTKRELLKFAENNNKSSAAVLLEAFEKYKTNPALQKAFEDYKTKVERKNSKITEFLESIENGEKKKHTKPFQDRKCSDKKNFKIKKVFADELDAACRQSGYSYGCFVTKLLEEYMNSKEKEEPITEKNNNIDAIKKDREN